MVLQTINETVKLTCSPSGTLFKTIKTGITSKINLLNVIPIFLHYSVNSVSIIPCQQV